jgi:hypothetical protein
MGTIQHCIELCKRSSSVLWIITSAKDGESPLLDDKEYFSLVGQLGVSMCTSGRAKTLYLFKRILTLTREVASEPEVDPLLAEAICYIQYEPTDLLPVYESELERLYSEDPRRAPSPGHCRHCDRVVEQYSVAYASADNPANVATTVCLICLSKERKKWLVYCPKGCGTSWWIPASQMTVEYKQRIRVGETRHSFPDKNYFEALEYCVDCKSGTSNPPSKVLSTAMVNDVKSSAKKKLQLTQDMELIGFVEANVANCRFTLESKPTHRDETKLLLDDAARRKLYSISKRADVPEQIRLLREAIEIYNKSKPKCKISAGVQVSVKGYLMTLLCPVILGDTTIVGVSITPRRELFALILHNGNIIDSNVSVIYMSYIYAVLTYTF